MLQPPFVDADELAEGEGEHEIDDAHDDQTFEGQIGGALHDQVGGHQIPHEEGGGQGRFLDDGDEFVAQGGQDVLHRLGQDDLAHGLGLGEAQAAGGFALTRVHGLDAGADDLRHIGGAVDDQGHGNTGEGAEAQGGHQQRHDEVAHIQLQQHGRAPDHLHKGGDQEPQELQGGHLHQGQQGAQDGAEEHRDGGQGQRDADALDQEHIPILGQKLDDVLKYG